METLKRNKNIIVLSLGLLVLILVLAGKSEKLGSVTIDSACATSSSTSTRVTLGSSVAGTRATTTMISSCTTGSLNTIALNWANEASTTATVSYDVLSSEDAITWYTSHSGTVSLTSNATNTKQVLLGTFQGTYLRVQGNSTATTSSNLKVLRVEEIAR